jgi:hypothetical protein
MPKHRRKLPPELTKPLEPLRLGLLADDDHKAQVLAGRNLEISLRMLLLADVYNIKPGPLAGQWLALKIDRDYSRGRPPRMTPQYVAREFGRLESLRVACGIPAGPAAGWLVAYRFAQQHIRGFQEERRSRGRPTAYTPFELAMLAGEVRRERMNGAKTITEACRRIARLPPWKAWLKSRWNPTKSSNGSGDTLRKAYVAMDKRHRRVGEDAYRFHVLNNTPEKWALMVAKIEQPPLEK